MTKTELFKRLKNTMIVSCQSSEDNPLCTAEHMALLASCSKSGGCTIFRVDSPLHIQAVKHAVPNAVIIGIWKVISENSDIYITPSMKEVDALIKCGVDIIAVDGTCQKNEKGLPAYTLISEIKKKYPNIPIMADIATIQDAEESLHSGADILSTTLRGYTKDTIHLLKNDCDLSFIKELRSRFSCFITAEGKIWTKEIACCALNAGADAVVIGTAINNPKCITERFLEGIKEELHK